MARVSLEGQAVDVSVATPMSESLVWDNRGCMPEQLPEIVSSLLALGYEERDIRLILGENFLRIARQVRQ